MCYLQKQQDPILRSWLGRKSAERVLISYSTILKDMHQPTRGVGSPPCCFVCCVLSRFHTCGTCGSQVPPRRTKRIDKTCWSIDKGVVGQLVDLQRTTSYLCSRSGVLCLHTSWTDRPSLSLSQKAISALKIMFQHLPCPGRCAVLCG